MTCYNGTDFLITVRWWVVMGCRV